MTDLSSITTTAAPISNGEAPSSRPTVKFDPEDLTLGELEEFEELAGTTAAAYLSGDPRYQTAKGTTTLLFLLHRRQNPSFTLEEARRLKGADIVELFGGSEDAGTDEQAKPNRAQRRSAARSKGS